LVNMTLWFIFGIMTAVALAIASWPLVRGRAASAGASDVAVYRDQLEEIERDRADGRIGHNEFEAARAEVSRRLLGAASSAGEASSTAGASPQRWRRLAALAVVVVAIPLIAVPLGTRVDLVMRDQVVATAVPLIAVPVYKLLGSPEITVASLAGGAAANGATPGDGQAASIASVIARIEQHLKENPDDSRGWEIIAPVYMKLGRYDDAVKARRNILAQLGPTAQREADLGVALAFAAGEEVTPDSKAAFERALALEPGNVNAMYFLGIAAQQDGNDAEAARIWRDIIVKAPPGAPYLATVRERLAGVSSEPAPAPAPGSYGLAARPPAPTAEEMAAVRGMTPEAQGQFMRDRIEGLAARLRQDGTDVAGWLRLLRAYMVLGERDKAKVAAGEARRALSGEPEKLKLLDAGLRDDEGLRDLAVSE
jgi:cytochrome c-type biogenesis protein CcmH